MSFNVDSTESEGGLLDPDTPRAHSLYDESHDESHEAMHQAGGAADPSDPSFPHKCGVFALSMSNHQAGLPQPHLQPPRPSTEEKASNAVFLNDWKDIPARNKYSEKHKGVDMSLTTQGSSQCGECVNKRHIIEDLSKALKEATSALQSAQRARGREIANKPIIFGLVLALFFCLVQFVRTHFVHSTASD